MPANQFLHDLKEFPDLISIVAHERSIEPYLIEKDYWIMHCLYGLKAQGFVFELKGGTSLSKGFSIIERFSEDIDIHINPEVGAGKPDFQVFTGKNQTRKESHNNSRRDFYDWLTERINIQGIIEVTRDTSFDDARYYRSGGIRLHYPSHLSRLEGIKEGVLLELGFDDTTPSQGLDISSWAYDHATTTSVTYMDNRALDIPCYHPGYTFVEKLQTVSTKYRQQQKNGDFPANFLRHYYDLAQLLKNSKVQEFIGTEDYYERKELRFRSGDNFNISENEAFWIPDSETRMLYQEAFEQTRSLYYGEQPDFENILLVIQEQAKDL
jgi:predicted nucleotidyltransferase component of viral defense system